MPIFKAMVEAAEEIILRLHTESFAEQSQQGMTQASAYMQALTSHLTHCRYPAVLSDPLYCMMTVTNMQMGCK